MGDKNQLTPVQTAKILGITTSSIKNWEKHGYLQKKGGYFYHDEVMKLLDRIQNGEVNRLNSRANKLQAGGVIVPSGPYASLCREVSELTAEVSEIMFLVSIRLFILHGLIKQSSLSEILDFKPEYFSNAVVLKHLKKRFSEICPLGEVTASTFNNAAVVIMGMDLPEARPSDIDIAGIIYQSVNRRGDRAASGSFYTQPDIAEKMIASAVKILKKDITEIHCIDPCCGTGQFLLSFIKAGGKTENISGIDSDETAAFIAATNILLQCPGIDNLPRITIADSLLDDFEENWDLLITNPPWGACTKEKRSLLEDRYPDIKSGESFAYFLKRSFELVNNSGIISMVLPESITNVKRHQDIRKLIFKSGKISKITKHGRAFKAVYSPVITIEINKSVEEQLPLSRCCGYTLGDGYVIDQNYMINININSSDIRIIDKIYSMPHINLKDNADWALGIVTGDNQRWVTKQEAEGSEPVIRGVNITSNGIINPSQFISFHPEKFQQSAPEWKYRSAEKLVYKFISKRLILAIDTESRLTLNSANILIPDTGKLSEYGITALTIMQLFNSDIYNFIFQKKFNSVKVLRSHLEELPLPTEPQIDFLNSSELEYIKNNLQ